jgi:hypothetical protein
MFVYIRYPYVCCVCVGIYSTFNGTGPSTPAVPSDRVTRSYLIQVSYFPHTGVKVPWTSISCQRDLLLLSTGEKNFDLANGAQGEATLLGHYGP